MSSIDCSIPSNPDISGIGVRAAIYVQNLISFIPAFWALWDGEVSLYELESAETQSTTILITAFAILISAMAQAKAQRLSNFHANIVLSLSWMNNTNTFIYFLLYVHHKSEPRPGQIKMDWRCWLKHVHAKLSAFFSFSWSIPGGTPDLEKQEHQQAGPPEPSHLSGILRRIVLVLGSLHLSVMATLGIWLWNSPRSFGSTNDCAVEGVSTFILGARVLLSSGALRAASITIYSLFLAPGLNLILPMGLFLGLFLGYQKRRQNRASTVTRPDPYSTSTPAPLRPSPSRFPLVYSRRRIFMARVARPPTSPSIVPIVLGLVILFAVNIIFLIDIELTLRQSGPGDESTWTFGQTLAILLLVLPLRDIVETMVARREKARQDELKRQEKEHDDELERREKARRDEHTTSLVHALNNKAEMRAIIHLIERGANANVVPDGFRGSPALHLASRLGDTNSVARLLSLGADPGVIGGEWGTALQASCNSGNVDTVRLLLEHQADPNMLEGIHGTALYAASGGNMKYRTMFKAESCPYNIDMVKLLLEHRADPNIIDGTHESALQTASGNGTFDIVKLLLEHQAEPNIIGGRYPTALQIASYRRNIDVVKLLLEHQADPNIIGKQEHVGRDETALQTASFRGEIDIAKLLLKHHADPNIIGGDFGTALQAASYSGRIGIVKLLLEHQADPDIIGGRYGTALQAASYSGKIDIAKLLLEHQADPNIIGGRYGTALQAASYSGRTAIVKLLLEHQVDPNIIAREFGTALRAASLSGNFNIVQLLLERRADPNIIAEPYGTALQAASATNHPTIVKLLLANGADPNTPRLSFGDGRRNLKYLSSAHR